MSNTFLDLPNPPSIPGLTFRLYQGATDIPALQSIRAAEGNPWLPGPDTDPATAHEPSPNCVIAEVADQAIGYTWLLWWTEADGTHLYLHLGWIIPAWRRKGIGHTLLRWQEQRLRQIAQSQSTHPITGTYMFGGNADENQPGNRALLLSEGYTLAFTGVLMTCHVPTSPIQLAPLPAGLRIRPVELEHLPAIYTANDEAFSASRTGHIKSSYEAFLNELGWPELDTNLWIVAWDGDQIAGHVINTIDKDGAHTPWVAVRRPWRQRGLGKALMTRTLQRFQERHITHAKITTNAENPGHSVHLYESVGYHVTARQPRYRKPM